MVAQVIRVTSSEIGARGGALGLIRGRGGTSERS
jgi:hypothetical protein